MNPIKTLPIQDAQAMSQSADPTMPNDSIGENDGFSAPIRKSRKIQTKLASDSKQHVIFVRDHSSSMSGSKLQELNMASHALIAELADPDNKNGFICSIVDFSSGAKIVVETEYATALKLPEAQGGGGTNFDAALLKTINVVSRFKSRPNHEGWAYLQPVVIFLSDGQSNVSDKNIEDLQEMAHVLAVAYGSDAQEATLSRIASDGQVHHVGTNGGELRKFLAEVGKTLSQGLAKA